MVASLVVAGLLAAVLALTPRTPVFRGNAGERIHAALGGIAVAYVFLHVLPTLARLQHAIDEARLPHVLGGLAMYVLALVGFVVAWFAMGTGDEDLPARSNVGFRIGLIAVYSLAIGSSVARSSPAELPFDAVALGPHLLGSSRWTGELSPHNHRRSHALFAGALMSGWIIASLAPPPVEVRAMVAGLIAGGLIVNTFLVELKELRALRLGAFVLGAVGLAIVSVVSERFVGH